MMPFKEQVPEFEAYEHPVSWHVAAGITGGVLLAWGLLSGNYLFTAFVALASAALIIKDSRSPSFVPFEIDDHGVLLGSRKWNISDFKGYAVLPADASSDTLVLILSKRLHEAHPLRVTTHSAGKAVKALEAIGLKEVTYEESLLDMLVRLLRL